MLPDAEQEMVLALEFHTALASIFNCSRIWRQETTPGVDFAPLPTPPARRNRRAGMQAVRLERVFSKRSETFMDLGINGKVAIITGGSEGIGFAAASRLSNEGAQVVLVSRTQADLDARAASLSKASGNEVMGIACDMRNEDEVEAMVKAVVARFGGIDILINNAGTSMATKFASMTNDMVDEDFGLKVKGAIFAVRHAYPYLQQGGGVICNTTTPGGKAARGGSQPTSMSRAAGMSLTKAWAHEFAADGIRVNTVCVGMFKSRQHQRRFESRHANDGNYSIDDHWDSLCTNVPLGRVGEAEEAGDVIAFLCSARASYVTGTAINVDGGASPVV